jgi:molybdate transport system substrate-binding protein
MIDLIFDFTSRKAPVQRRWLAPCSAFFLLLASSLAQAQDLTIAAASDLQGALPAIVAQFERQTGRRVRVTFGSSGNFFAQIQNGAPFDLYFSADIDYPRRLEAAGVAEPGSLLEYAVGSIVQWAPKNGVDVTQGLAVLASPAVRKIAIANPEHAPYGRAAVAALKAAGLYDRVQQKLVLGENISQAAQFVQSGNAEVGIVALSIALLPALTGTGHYAAVPPGTYPPIEQAVIVVKASTHKEIAREFLRFFNQPAAVTQMQRLGFTRPTAPARR